MSDKLIMKILDNKQSVRKIIDEAARVNEDFMDAENGDDVALGKAVSHALTADDDNANEYGKLFIRRYPNGGTSVKKESYMSAEEALNTFFYYCKNKPKDRIEIWVSNGAGDDAKAFYQYCMKNLAALKKLWNGSKRLKETLAWNSVLLDLKDKARKSGSAVTGTLYPFAVEPVK